MQNPVESDAGEYVCSVANGDGRISSGSGFVTYGKLIYLQQQFYVTSVIVELKFTDTLVM